MTPTSRTSVTSKAKSQAKSGALSELDTRDRVVRATIECITALGFYRGSSTNEIVRRAGVTWGVIQHYFGTREGLMLAVLESEAHHMVETVEDAQIDAASVSGRIGQLIEVLSMHYDRPEYLASLQILLNLDHDPKTSDEVRTTMQEVARRSQAHILRLLRQALGPAAKTPDLATTVFLLLRGFGFSQLLLESMSYDSVTPKRAKSARYRQLLTELLTPYVELASAGEA